MQTKDELSEIASVSLEAEDEDYSQYTTWQLMKSDIGRWAKMWRPPETADSVPVSLKDSVKVVWAYCGLRATLLYRISHGLWRKGVPFLPGMVGRLNLTLYGFDIPQHVPMGPGFYMPHPVGTVITAKRIGANVSMISAVTVGMGNTWDFPDIKDNVFIGAGARVLGAITVGEGAKIGANAVVITDVPPGATAVGVPAKIKAGS